MNMSERSIFKSINWINIGPFYNGGRVTDIEAYEDMPSTFYVGSAAGGVWFTSDNGKTWKSIFGNQSSIGIGDIAISQQNKNLIWVATGEANSSHSCYAGTGMYKSVDGGNTWMNMGLQNTHHISRVIIDPSHNDTVYVAALGHLYTRNQERGIYKTIDGGRTWKKVLYVSEKSGFSDLAMHPRNSDILYAASWEKDRKAWNFIESGVESAIFKTTDGGQTWRKTVSGFPQGRYNGRIGLAISRSEPSVVYALLDNQEPRPEMIKSGITIEMVAAMNVDDFLSINGDKLDLFLRENRAPLIYDSHMVKGFVKSGKISPRDIARIFSNAQERRLNPYVKGAEIYRSDDGGNSWHKMNPGYLEGMVLTYGFYFGQIRVSPENKNIIYILGIPLLKSEDGGISTIKISDEEAAPGEEMVHRDCHALWINPGNPSHLILGTDGGVNISYHAGKVWQKIGNIPLAQCYSVQFDYHDPFRIICGLQDNGIMIGSSRFRMGDKVNAWRTIWGGDGAFVDLDRENPDIVFVESQFGMIYRLDFKNKIMKSIQPQPEKDRIPYRFNWLSPFMISNHQPATLYMGSNHLLKSIDRGDSWSEISPDLSNRKDILGNMPYATITAVDESVFSPQIIFVGTDDGNVWVTRDTGANWKKISLILPGKWVSGVVASRFRSDRLYVTMTGFREDDFAAYIYSTDNDGLDWEDLKSNLPDEPVNVIREDPKDGNILYVGTDMGVYVTFNRGGTWHSLKGNLPNVPVLDLKVHPRDNMLIIGTHARGVFLVSTDSIKNQKK
jgi:photosystem II stability/assembly factor-like uncharacterized protein